MSFHIRMNGSLFVQSVKSLVCIGQYLTNGPIERPRALCLIAHPGDDKHPVTVVNEATTEAHQELDRQSRNLDALAVSAIDSDVRFVASASLRSIFEKVDPEGREACVGQIAARIQDIRVHISDLFANFPRQEGGVDRAEAVPDDYDELCHSEMVLEELDHRLRASFIIVCGHGRFGPRL